MKCASFPDIAATPNSLSGPDRTQEMYHKTALQTLQSSKEERFANTLPANDHAALNTFK